MASIALVVTGIAEGARLVDGLDEAGVPIEVAFWLLTAEYSDWRLVLATPLYDERGADQAYGQILPVLRALDDVDYLMDKITIVGTDDRRVRALRSALPRGLPKPNYYLGQFYARDMEVLDSYVYRLAPLATATANGAATARGKARPGRNGAAGTRTSPSTSRD